MTYLLILQIICNCSNLITDCKRLMKLLGEILWLCKEVKNRSMSGMLSSKSLTFLDQLSEYRVQYSPFFNIHSMQFCRSRISVISIKGFNSHNFNFLFPKIVRQRSKNPKIVLYVFEFFPLFNSTNLEGFLV